jgi:hypothetical protein
MYQPSMRLSFDSIERIWIGLFRFLRCPNWPTSSFRGHLFCSLQIQYTELLHGAWSIEYLELKREYLELNPEFWIWFGYVKYEPLGIEIRDVLKSMECLKRKDSHLCILWSAIFSIHEYRIFFDHSLVVICTNNIGWETSGLWCPTKRKAASISCHHPIRFSDASQLQVHLVSQV